jgi:hypothetical protein
MQKVSFDHATQTLLMVLLAKLFLYAKSKLTNSVAQEPEGSSPHSQQPAAGPCPEPVESNPHPPSQST